MDKIDEIDEKLLRALQTDAKQPIKQLAKGVSLSITPVHERIKKLEQSGIIKGYSAIIDHQKLGKDLTAYCHVSLKQHREDMFELFTEHILTLDEVIEASYIAGSYDLILKVVIPNMQQFHELVLKKISRLDFVANIQSSFVIKTIR